MLSYPYEPFQLTKILRYISFLALLFGCMAIQSVADEGHHLPNDLTAIGFEELLLLDVTVTSVSKKEQKLSDVPAAIHVISGEEIRRSGVQTIAEALRLAPGVHVARVNSGFWAVSSRGFNDELNDMILVLIDGRRVFTPLFGGVFWDAQDTLLEDIDRIEVIRGPGGTIWGANAINGVINIITKSAKNTQGGFVSAGGGKEEQVFGSVRYGDAIDEETFYRIFAKGFKRDDQEASNKDEAEDRWHGGHGGFRVDSVNSDATWMLQGNYYATGKRESIMQPILSPELNVRREERGSIRGAHLLGTWDRQFDSTGKLSLLAYYDHTEREMVLFEEDRDTIEFDVTHEPQIKGGHTVVWGVGYRVTFDKFRSRKNVLALIPSSENLHLFSAFLQDEIMLIEDTLSLVMGSKLEYSEIGDFQIQPTARFLWDVTDSQSMWFAVTRAVGYSSRAGRDIEWLYAMSPSVSGLPQALFVIGNKDIEEERLVSFELGWRSALSNTASIDVATFYNIYDNVNEFYISGDSQLVSNPMPYVSVPVMLSSDSKADTFGVEIFTRVNPCDWWSLSGGYSYINIDYNRSTDVLRPEGDGASDPEHLAQLHSRFDLPGNMQFDLSTYYTDIVPGREVDSNIRLDSRFAWRPVEFVEIEFIGHNLTDKAHDEFNKPAFPFETSRHERAFIGRITWRF